MIEKQTKLTQKRNLTYAIVGGGPGAFIGDVHRLAIRIDNRATLASGVFSSNPDKSKEFGLSLGLDKTRLYDDYEQMVHLESKRIDRVDFVVIVTPNAFHYKIAKACLEHNFHVMCDKPLTITSEEAKELSLLSKRNNLLFGVTYTYTGYPVVKHIRALIKEGTIGTIRFVNGEYPQQWLATPSEDDGNKQAAWRTNPELTGASNCVGDIGSHIENLVATTTGLTIKRVSARLDSFVDGRVLDDNATIMIDYNEGAKGIYWASQIAVGSDNALKIRIYGSKGSITWSQEDPDHFILSLLGEATRLYSRGRDIFVPSSQKYSRLPAGHPEGVFEAFANLYRAFIDSVEKYNKNEEINTHLLEFPTVDEGLNGVKFIEACVNSSLKDSAWVSL
ncbi:MAG: Gfo/Idh/MocA family oxidoreductase [Spirochaetia bacterium]|nr:Gfo/Idh/MocA family oxidoreductase [Spirochaetia bacterium]